MNPGKRLQALMLMALVVIAGLIGMLLAEGPLDQLFLLLASLPLILGGWRWWRSRRVS